LEGGEQPGQQQQQWQQKQQKRRQQVVAHTVGVNWLPLNIVWAQSRKLQWFLLLLTTARQAVGLGEKCAALSCLCTAQPQMARAAA
jgi:hypothetical protein